MTLYCKDPLNKGCHWSGTQDELVATDEEDSMFSHCPYCEGSDFDEEEEEEEQ